MIPLKEDHFRDMSVHPCIPLSDSVLAVTAMFNASAATPAAPAAPAVAFAPSEAYLHGADGSLPFANFALDPTYLSQLSNPTNFKITQFDKVRTPEDIDSAIALWEIQLSKMFSCLQNVTLPGASNSTATTFSVPRYTTTLLINFLIKGSAVSCYTTPTPGNPPSPTPPCPYACTSFQASIGQLLKMADFTATSGGSPACGTALYSFTQTLNQLREPCVSVASGAAGASVSGTCQVSKADLNCGLGVAATGQDVSIFCASMPQDPCCISRNATQMNNTANGPVIAPTAAADPRRLLPSLPPTMSTNAQVTANAPNSASNAFSNATMASSITILQIIVIVAGVILFLLLLLTLLLLLHKRARRVRDRRRRGMFWPSPSHSRRSADIMPSWVGRKGTLDRDSIFMTSPFRSRKTGSAEGGTEDLPFPVYTPVHAEAAAVVVLEAPAALQSPQRKDGKRNNDAPKLALKVDTWPDAKKIEARDAIAEDDGGGSDFFVESIAGAQGATLRTTTTVFTTTEAKNDVKVPFVATPPHPSPSYPPARRESEVVSTLPRFGRTARTVRFRDTLLVAESTGDDQDSDVVAASLITPTPSTIDDDETRFGVGTTFRTPALTYAIRDFVAVREDEMAMREGDGVEVRVAFPDGWSYGTNMRTGESGVFPTLWVFENAGVVEDLVMVERR
ncbi:hypothetical protein HK101_009942 [Irineochytrium annulatum]|nr:hypothetical protein HK101_009942 [Irineochytrium annulatum]